MFPFEHYFLILVYYVEKLCYILIMYVIFKEHEQFFCIDTAYLDTFIISQYFYRVPMNPDFLEGVENYRGEIYPVVSISGTAGQKKKSSKVKYLILLNESLGFMLQSTLKPKIIEEFEESVKVEVMSEFESITSGGFMLSGDIVYHIDMKKFEKKIAEQQKNYERN